jgi:hypothetical protein
MNKQEQMYHLVSEYHQSGQSAKSFCEAKQIKHSTFQYWVHKEKRSKEAAFVPIKTENPYTGQNTIELVYPNGVKLRLEHFDLDQIGRLINLR